MNEEGIRCVEKDGIRDVEEMDGIIGVKEQVRACMHACHTI